MEGIATQVHFSAVFLLFVCLLSNLIIHSFQFLMKKKIKRDVATIVQTHTHTNIRKRCVQSGG